MHFGGSRSQASLHTAVLYTKDTAKSFCTNHSPQGIWAHMDPVLQQIRTTMPKVKCMHFISDGSTTQYRSKNNFYLFNKVIHPKYGFSRSTWNCTEAGHGKGAADGGSCQKNCKQYRGKGYRYRKYKGFVQACR